MKDGFQTVLMLYNIIVIEEGRLWNLWPKQNVKVVIVFSNIMMSGVGFEGTSRSDWQNFV